MRIVFLTLKLDLDKGGGANRGLDIKLRTLQQRGHTVELITLFPELNRLPPEGLPYPVREASCPDHAFMAMQQHAVKVLREAELRADVFEIDSASFFWAGGMYRAGGGRVPVATYIPIYMEALMPLTPVEAPDPAHGIVKWASFYLGVWSLWLKHLLWAKTKGLPYACKLDLIFSPSPILEDAYANFGFPREKMALMPEFVDGQSFLNEAGPAGPIPPAFGPDRPFRLLYAGRFIRAKGPDMLIRAVAELQRSGRNVEAVMLGDGPQQSRLERLLTELNVGSAVQLKSWTTERELAHAYAACDAFIHPCRWPEPLGRTILEALFFGRPIISTTGTGSAWAAADAGTTAIRGSQSDLTRTLAALYDDPSRLAAMSAAAPSRVAFFNYQTWATKLIESFEKLRAASAEK